MAARKVHDVLNIEAIEFRQMPPWLTTFLEKIQKRPHATKPPALLVSEQDGCDCLVVLRLSDLLELVRADNHPMEAETPHEMHG